MLLRLILWLLIIYIVIKLIRIFSRMGSYSSFESKRTATPPFDDIEEAKFEDITPKPKESDSSDSDKSEQTHNSVE